MSNTSSSFAIMGSGGVGGYFGAELAKAGYETTFIARGGHLSTMRKNGLSVTKLGETSVQQVTATDKPDKVGPVDFILFSIKLWDTIEAAKQIAPMVGKKTMILSLQNGISSEEVLIAHYGANQVLGGVAEISAIIKEPGHIDCRSPFARIYYGEMGDPAPNRIEQLNNALEEAGIEHGHVPEISSRIWKKFIFLVGLSALTTATDRTIGEIREDDTDRARLYQVMDETLTIARAKGIALPDDLLSPIMAFVDALPHTMRASMSEDLRAGRQLELDWLSGKVVALGQSLGIETPVNSEIVTEIRKQISG